MGPHRFHGPAARRSKAAQDARQEFYDMVHFSDVCPGSIQEKTGKVLLGMGNLMGTHNIYILQNIIKCYIWYIYIFIIIIILLLLLLCILYIYIQKNTSEGPCFFLSCNCWCECFLVRPIEVPKLVWLRPIPCPAVRKQWVGCLKIGHSKIGC